MLIGWLGLYNWPLYIYTPHFLLLSRCTAPRPVCPSCWPQSAAEFKHMSEVKHTVKHWGHWSQRSLKDNTFHYCSYERHYDSLPRTWLIKAVSPAPFAQVLCPQRWRNIVKVTLKKTWTQKLTCLTATEKVKINTDFLNLYLKECSRLQSHISDPEILYSLRWCVISPPTI